MASSEKPKSVRQKQKWGDLPKAQRIAIMVAGTIELVLTSAAAIDLVRRPGKQIRGPKALWWLGIFVQPAGSIAYLRWARHKPAQLTD
ncbi:MAG TPA: PLDc N-terminal domain-containing protein [Pseudonocardiaceae bacterium]